ncbi:MAG: carbohydrate ABC transporter permease [Planctomycetota bacterium]|jgi:multiple sugar transport system permease protein
MTGCCGLLAAGAAPYLGTLARFVGVGAALALVCFGVHRIARGLGRTDREATGLALVAPFVIGLVAFTAWPVLCSFYLSFTRYRVLGLPEWAGLSNYAEIILDDRRFRAALFVSSVYAAASIPLGIAASLTTAMLLNTRVRFVGVWRTVYYLPSVLPAVATALVWRWLFVPHGGLVNSALGALSLPQPGWFHDPRWVIPAFVIMSLQGATGNNMVIFLAALKGVRAELHEAAMIDGAGWWSRFRHVTIPQISPVILYQLVMGIIGSLQVFTQPMFVETPGDSGLFYNVYVYGRAWEDLRMGYACALSWILFVIILGLTLAVLRRSRAWVYYEAEGR